MQVALVLEHLDPRRGGLEQWTWQFARRLLQLGHTVHVVAFDCAPEVLQAGVIHHPVAEQTSRVAGAAALGRTAAGLGVEVVHDMGCGWQGTIIHPHGGSPRAHFRHNLLRIPRWRRITFWREKRYRELEEIERRQLASGAVIVCVSEMVKRHFLELRGVTESRLRVIRNGADVARFSPAACAPLRAPTRSMLGLEDQPVMVMVAHNLQLKNAATAIRAAARLPQARLLIVGSNRQERVRKLARKLRVPVRFIGPVHDVLPYYAAADMCVHPTWYDPCSLVTIEAMACGLPVVTTRCNGAAELLPAEAREFVLEDPADDAALAGRVEQLFDPVLRLRLGTLMRRVAEAYTLERQAEDLLALYGEAGCHRAQTGVVTP